MMDARRFGRAATVASAGLVGLALVAAPVAFEPADVSLVDHVALANRGGNPAGGPGSNHGKSAEAGKAKAGAVTAAGFYTELEDGQPGSGHAKGKGLGHAMHGDFSGVSAQGHSQGISAASLDALGDLGGNLNAAHASATAMAHASPNSMPGKIAAAVAASYTGDPALDESGFIDADEIDDEALASELGKISNKATIDSASGEPTVDQGVVDAVKGLVDGKVSVDAVEPAAATDSEDGV